MSNGYIFTQIQTWHKLVVHFYFITHILHSLKNPSYYGRISSKICKVRRISLSLKLCRWSITRASPVNKRSTLALRYKNWNGYEKWVHEKNIRGKVGNSSLYNYFSVINLFVIITVNISFYTLFINTLPWLHQIIIFPKANFDARLLTLSFDIITF